MRVEKGLWEGSCCRHSYEPHSTPRGFRSFTLPLEKSEEIPPSLKMRETEEHERERTSLTRQLAELESIPCSWGGSYLGT